MQKLNAPDLAPDLIFEVDQEHSGVRMIGCFTFLLGTVFSYLVLNTIFPNGGFIVIGLALAAAIALTYGADYLTKTYWPSNRTIQFVGDMIRLAKGTQLQGEIDVEQNVNLLMWHFEARRHPRVPKAGTW